MRLRKSSFRFIQTGKFSMKNKKCFTFTTLSKQKNKMIFPSTEFVEQNFPNVNLYCVWNSVHQRLDKVFPFAFPRFSCFGHARLKVFHVTYGNIHARDAISTQIYTTQHILLTFVLFFLNTRIPLLLEREECDELCQGRHKILHFMYRRILHQSFTCCKFLWCCVQSKANERANM